MNEIAWQRTTSFSIESTCTRFAIARFVDEQGEYFDLYDGQGLNYFFNKTASEAKAKANHILQTESNEQSK